MQVDPLDNFYKCLYQHALVIPVDGSERKKLFNIEGSLSKIDFELSEARVRAKIQESNVTDFSWEALKAAAVWVEPPQGLVEMVFWKDVDCSELGRANQSKLIEICSNLFDINDLSQLKNTTDVVVDVVETLFLLAKEELLYVEGAEHQVTSKRLERSQALRDKAIQIHGCRCAICCFCFKENYGPLGDAFIHIHHIERLADTGKRLVNPKTDLIPVCPNCHAMLHRRSPPLLPQELIKKIEETKDGSSILIS